MQNIDCLKSEIEKYFGFKKDLIQDVVECGCWCVRFTVNGIKYYGCVAYHGAEPQLSVEGYTTKYYWHGTPVTEEYYNEFIKGKCIRLQQLCFESDEGDWEWLNQCFSTPEEAEEYIGNLEEPNFYTYDIYEE